MTLYIQSEHGPGAKKGGWSPHITVFLSLLGSILYYDHSTILNYTTLTYSKMCHCYLKAHYLSVDRCHTTHTILYCAI